MNSNLQTFAIVTDRTRRAGVRVARVFVLHVWDAMEAAEVEERGMQRVTHHLPFSRLAKVRAGLGRKLKQFIEAEAAKEFGSSLAAELSRFVQASAPAVVRTSGRNEFGELVANLPYRQPYAD